MLGEGVSKEEILAQTGNVVGVVDVSLEVKPGEIFVVMGLSGSGKSTLIRCINRLYEPSSGRVLIDDTDITGVSEQELRQLRRSKLAMVFQHFALFPHRSVFDNVEYGLKVRGTARDERRAAAEEALELVGLTGWGEYRPSSLSGGMRQRVGLARALAAKPEILLMDEAFSALDPMIKREMQDELITIQEKIGTTIVFITHDLNEALKLGDRTAIMRDGRVVQVGTPQEIIRRPASEYIYEFTRDVDRGRVLTLRSVMKPVTVYEANGAGAGGALAALEAAGKSECIVTRGGVPQWCVSEEQLKTATESSGQDFASVGAPVEVAPASTVLMDAFKAAADGHCITAVNRRGEYVGHADPTDILGALTLSDYTPAAPSKN